MITRTLICPSCRCPLSPPAAASHGMHCWRCNTYLELDPLCLGSCLSCHKRDGDGESDCLEETEEISVPVVVKS